MRVSQQKALASAEPQTDNIFKVARRNILSFYKILGKYISLFFTGMILRLSKTFLRNALSKPSKISENSKKIWIEWIPWNINIFPLSRNRGLPLYWVPLWLRFCWIFPVALFGAVQLHVTIYIAKILSTWNPCSENLFLNCEYLQKIKYVH